MNTTPQPAVDAAKEIDKRTGETFDEEILKEFAAIIARHHAPLVERVKELEEAERLSIEAFPCRMTKEAYLSDAKERDALRARVKELEASTTPMPDAVKLAEDLTKAILSEFPSDMLRTDDTTHVTSLILPVLAAQQADLSAALAEVERLHGVIKQRSARTEKRVGDWVTIADKERVRAETAEAELTTLRAEVDVK